MKQYSVIAFKPGYVESNSVAWLIYETSDSFASRKEAIGSFVVYLFYKFTLDYKKVNSDNWHNFINRLIELNNDSYGYGTHEEAQQICGYDWDYCSYMFKKPIEETIVIAERAGEFFLYTLKETHPGLFEEFEEMDDYDINGPNDMDKKYYGEIINGGI